MGGGVTVYESVFLKRKVIGCDLNPLSEFIVINMLDDKSSLEEFDQACKLVSEYLKDIKFQFNEIKKINWCELTYQVICNECKNKTILSNEQKVDLLVSYSYEEQEKLYDSYNPPGSMVIAGCSSFIILAMIISSSSSSNSSDSGGFWRAFENFMNGFFND